MVRSRPGKTVLQRGQAYVEYLIVTSVIVAALMTGFPGPDDPSAVERLVNAIKRTYSGYSYGISVAELPDENDAPSGAGP